MLRFLIFLFPAMVDVIIGTLIFVTNLRLVNSGAEALDCTLPATTWALGHSVFSFFVARINNTQRSPFLIVFGCLVMAAGSLLLIFLNDPNLQIYWALVVGLGSAFFFCSFQVFMKASDKDVHAGLVRSTALYGFAWSCGIASGPFIASLIWGRLDPVNGWKYCYWISIALVLIVASATWPLKYYIENHHKKTPEAAPEPKPFNKPKTDYSRLPDLVWLGWLTAGIGCLTVTLIRTIFPYKAKILQLSNEQVGLIVALASYSQAFFSLMLIKSRYWMYKTVPMLLFSVCGIIGMVLFWCGTENWHFYLAALIYGVYSASFFFCLVFHSLVHPEKSGKYVSWNEVVVGLTGIIAGVAGGRLVDITGNWNLPFIIAAILILSVIAYQFISLRKIDPELVK
jgi:MFS family permease